MGPSDELLAGVARKLRALGGAFPASPTFRPAGGPAPRVLGQLRRAHRLWMRALTGLLDDGELEVSHRDGRGRRLPTRRLLLEVALDDVLLAGRLAGRFRPGVSGAPRRRRTRASFLLPPARGPR